MTLPRSHPRFLEMLAAHGADPARWPASERDWMLAHLARPEALAAQREAAALDAALDQLVVTPPAPTLRRSILEAVAREISPSRSEPSLLQNLRALWRELGGVRLAAPAFAMALAAGIGMGWMLDPVAQDADSSEDLLALAQFDDRYPELLP